MNELLVDFITSLDGYGAARRLARVVGARGSRVSRLARSAARTRLYDLDGSEHVPPDVRIRRSIGASGSELRSDEEASVNGLANASKVVFSSTLQPPLPWANTRADQRGCGRGCERDEAGRQQPDAHPWQPQLVPVAPQGRPRGPFPGGRLPRDHREHRLRTDLRRLSRCRPRHGCQPDI